MTDNPTLDTADYSREIVAKTIRPGLSDHLELVFEDPKADKRGEPVPGDEPSDWPPLVVTSLAGSGRVLYPHVVLSEQGDDAEQIDHRKRFSQHNFSVGVEIHGQTSTEMFNLRGLVRGWFLDNRALLRDAGLAEIELSGAPASWDRDSQTASWELTVTGLLHTHPDA